MAAWDNPRADVEHTLNEIVGVFHHPAFADGSDGRGGVEGRRKMFGVVRQWWEEKDESEREFLRHALSREGVEQGKNHKEGQHDSGHGCGKPIHRVKPKKDGGEFGVAEDMGKAVGSALEEAFLSGGQGGGSSSGFGGLLGGIAGAAFGGYMAGQMGGSGGGGEIRSSGVQEVRERGFGGQERGIERSYEQVGGEGRYQESSYERPAAHGDTATYLRNHAYKTGEGRDYYDAGAAERSGSHSTPGYESHVTTGYGEARGMPGAFESHEQRGHTGGGYGQESHSSSRHIQSTKTGGHSSETHHTSYTSNVSHQSSSRSGYTSHETRVEHQGHGGRGEGEHERRQKVNREYLGDEQGSGYYTERRYIKHHSGEGEAEHRRYKKSGDEEPRHRRRGSGDEEETKYRRRGSGDEEEEEEDEYERKKREKKERKRREKEHARRKSGSGDEYYGSGDD